MRRYLLRISIVAVLLTGCNSAPEETAATTADLPVNEVVVAEMEQPEPKADQAALPDDAPVLEFTVEEIHEALAGDMNFSEKAAGHWIEVTGIVQSFRQEGGTGAPGAYVTLREQGELKRAGIPKRVDVIMASLDEAWEKLTPGDEVTIRFQMSQWSGFYDGKVVAGGGGPVPRTTAQELVEAVKSDKTAAVEKYNEKYWIVTGTMADKQPYEDGFSFGFDDVYFSAVMQGDAETSIALELPYVRVINRLEPKEEVEILGKVKILNEELVTERKPHFIGILDGSRIDVDTY